MCLLWVNRVTLTRAPLISGPPRTTDNVRPTRHVGKVPGTLVYLLNFGSRFLYLHGTVDRQPFSVAVLFVWMP
jgi:hypothetical protein